MTAIIAASRLLDVVRMAQMSNGERVTEPMYSELFTHYKYPLSLTKRQPCYPLHAMEPRAL